MHVIKIQEKNTTTTDTITEQIKAAHPLCVSRTREARQ
jgi:hypothetical protein